MSWYNITIARSSGFHPVVTLSIHLDQTEQRQRSIEQGCSLWTHLDLSPSWILDRYQLAQLHREGRLGSHTDSTREGEDESFQVVGEDDLEGPVMKAGGVQALLRLQDPKGMKREEQLDFEVKIPLHLRYQTPVERRIEQGKRADVVSVQLRAPAVFWKCPPSNKVIRRCPPAPALSAFSSPVSSTSSYHYLRPEPLDPRASYSHASSCAQPRLPNLGVSIATGVSSDLPFVDFVNFIAIWLGTIWIASSAYKWQTRNGKSFEPAANKRVE
ncbi:BZ3500_MvSof-1268-A1-R1_Chr4-2g07178 [Microbotryum saponariae]|uniref:Protein PBN1 n=1 Tax=Microbotryum saponariae TaxID=289078 RepID=A0A2X0M498_9BASI|nr:BZ3500_MvSof-1268-A1-R1_Chr4-2g07178 [Microbotryum saponariae]SDA06843.1 BZ3501_MvSof-1269-A2-R1_Chr4-2g06889 [Microbotryum saponariae]